MKILFCQLNFFYFVFIFLIIFKDKICFFQSITFFEFLFPEFMIRPKIQGFKKLVKIILAK